MLLRIAQKIQRMRSQLNKKLNLHQVPSTFMNIKVAISLLLGELVFGVTGFMIIEGYSLGEAIYMAVITISTVGYTEVHPLSESGRLFAAVFIIINIGIFSYILAVFSYYVVQGEIFKNMHSNLINRQISELEDHIILCGYGKYGKEISSHFIKHQLPFVVIDIDPEEIEELQKGRQNILYMLDDATHDETLLKAGIKKAKSIISALPDDTENVFTVLTARQLNASIKIISRARDPKSQRKLLLAGANHVVMPEQIGGFYMATLVSQPGAVEFFSFITNEYKSDIGFEEIHYDDLPSACHGKTIRELHIRRETGANIIGYHAADGRYIVNPPPETRLVPNSSFIILGDKQQLNALRFFLVHYDDTEQK